MRTIIESEQVSANLNRWIDFIFGHKSRGEAKSLRRGRGSAGL
jgi:hypothetical protein